MQFLICVRGDSQGQSVLRALSQEDTKDMAAILIPTCYGTRAFCLATAGVVYAQTPVSTARPWQCVLSTDRAEELPVPHSVRKQAGAQREG